MDVSYEGKGEALIQLNRWLIWLEQAEEEDSDEDVVSDSVHKACPLC